MVDIVATIGVCSWLVYVGAKKNSWSRRRILFSVGIVAVAFLFVESYDHWAFLRAGFNAGYAAAK
jgi:high-affinity Fe2+/Pb2+ permease